MFWPCLSLVLGHVTVARHRSIDPVDDTPQPLSSMKYILGFAAMLVLVIVGCCLASFDFHIEGLAGLVLGDKAKRRYSMSLGEAIPGSSNEESGAVSLEVVYFFLGSFCHWSSWCYWRSFGWCRCRSNSNSDYMWLQ